MVSTRAHAKMLPPATPILAPWAPGVPEGGLRVLLDTPPQELDEIDRKRRPSTLSDIDENALEVGEMGPPSLNPKRLSRERLLFLKKKSLLKKDRTLFGMRRSFSLDMKEGTAPFKDLPKSDVSNEENEGPVVPFVVERGGGLARVVQGANKGVNRTETRPDPPLFVGSNAQAEARGNFRDIAPPLKVSCLRKKLDGSTNTLPAMRGASTPLSPRTRSSTIDKMDYMIDADDVETSNDRPQLGSPVVALLSSSFSQAAISPLPHSSGTVIDYKYRQPSTPTQAKNGGKRSRDEKESPQKVSKKVKQAIQGEGGDTEMDEGEESEEEDFGLSFNAKASMEL